MHEDRVHFAGAWPEPGARAVVEAIEAFESNNRRALTEREAASGWLCSAYRLGQGLRQEEVFVALREEPQLTIAERTLEGLVRRLRRTRL